MKIEVNIGKKHLVVFMIFIFVIISGIFVYAGVSGVSHAWDEITGKPDISNCAGSNQALKTINLGTGVVTCEADDAGGGLSSVSWGDIQGKPFTNFFVRGGEVVFITDSFLREVKRDTGWSNFPGSYLLQVRFRNGQFETRAVVVQTACGTYDSGWKTGNHTLIYTIGNSNCDSNHRYTGREGSISADVQNVRFVFTPAVIYGGVNDAPLVLDLG